MNLTKKLILGTALTGALLSPGCYEPTEPETTGDIFGSVYWDPDSDGVFEGARDAIVKRKGPDYTGGLPPHARTDRRGNYSFENIPAGFHLLEAFKSTAFKTHTGRKEVVVKNGKIVHADIFLKSY